MLSINTTQAKAISGASNTIKIILMLEVVKITKKVYKAVGCEEGHFFGTFAHFKELRENLNLSVQKTCFCCGHKFQPEDFISLACFDKGLGNKFLCQKCKNIALKDLGDKNIYLH